MSEKPYSKLALRLIAGLLAIVSIPLILGGLQLAGLGGSLWYLITGFVISISAVFLWRGNRWGAWLFGAMLAYTTVWAYWEVGLDGWALLPRLFAPFACGMLLLLPAVQRSLLFGPTRIRARYIGIVGLCAALLAIFTFGKLPETSKGGPIAWEQSVAISDEAGDWPSHANDKDATRYSALGQISPDNVSKLRLAWSFQTGDLAAPGKDYSYEATPLKIGDFLYMCTPSGMVVALNPATGIEQWRFDPKPDLTGVAHMVCRGISYFDTGRKAGTCARRIYVTSPDARLWALDAISGMPCKEFGNAGAVDLKDGLGEVPAGMYYVSSPPVVTGGRLVIGAKVPDNIAVDMPSGVIRAFDADSGALAWAWDIGRPDRTSAPDDGEHYTRSTPNAWAPFVADDKLGLVYVPTGNPAPDFWGRKRRSFDDEFGTSLVAIDVATGSTRWRFQITHHDLWDNDLPAQPVLVDWPVGSKTRPAVIQASKQGDLFVLDRSTGEPIVPVTERPVPQGTDLDERLSLTQPFSALSLNPGPTVLKETSMWGATPIDQLWCRIEFRKARYEGPYTPPQKARTSVVYPGMFGGFEWSGITIDPVNKILIANPSAMPFLFRIAPVVKPGGRIGDAEGAPPGLREMKGTGLAVSFGAFMSPLKIPCMQPPWGKIYAIDLKTGKPIWSRAAGTAEDTGPLGIASHIPLLIGTPQAGGTIVTQSGLIFASGTLDQYLRAYDIKDGRELWKVRLPAGGQATPMTYMANGRQYVVIVAGGHGILGTKPGDHVLAYAVN